MQPAPDSALEGGFADPPVAAAQAFRAALRALSRPGEIVTLAGATPPAPLSPAAGALLLTLADHDTPLWLAPGLNTTALRQWIAFHTGAPMAARGDARFALGPWDALLPLTDFAVGTPEYPDRSATLIVEGGLSGTPCTLSGPGIAATATLPLPDPAAFRANRALFPLGLDFFLTDGGRVAGVPRSTRVEG